MSWKLQENRLSELEDTRSPAPSPEAGISADEWTALALLRHRVRGSLSGDAAQGPVTDEEMRQLEQLHSADGPAEGAP